MKILLLTSVVLSAFIDITLGETHYEVYSSAIYGDGHPRLRLRRHVLDNVTCTLPPHPKYGRWRLINGEAEQGEKISSNTILEFHCRKGYKLSPKNPYVVCDKNGDFLNIPKCFKLCPPLYSTPTTILKCSDTNGDEVGCHEAIQETYLSYTCAPFYESPLGYRTSFCSDGEWNTVGTPMCQPVCGKKVHDDVKPLIFGGNVEKSIEYPWIAVIYKKECNNRYINICGGTVISQRLVLTAAHCVTNSYGDALPNSTYTVAAGKLFNKFNDSRDLHAQYLDVTTVIVHPNYRGENRRFLADIALLLTKDSFTLNNFVQPICFSDLKTINLQVGAIGIVPGFGIAEGDDPSETLRTLEIPYKSESTCAEELPSDWGDRYNVIDKLCAGFYNQNRSICSGDSGNGLYFKNPENNRYYIHGIASLGHSINGRCNIQQNSLYTKVAFHHDFIDRQIIKYYIKNCTLPPHPENGKWTTKNEDLQPGDTVRSSTILHVECEDGYKLSSESAYLTCESTFVMPTCLRRCPRPSVSRSIEYSCRNKEGEIIYCTEATDHTVLTFNCIPGTVPTGNKNTRICLNGAWDSSVACEWTITETSSEDDAYTRVVCIYDAKQYDTGIKPEDFNASLCTHVVYASVELSHDGVLKIPRNNASFVGIANMKKENTQLRVLVRVYGKGDKNDEYPTMAADTAKRTTFINEITNFLEKYNFDGLDVHWDVPLYKASYTTLLKELRETFDEHPGWLLAATVYYTHSYLGYDPPNLFDTVDWVNIECFNLYTEWSKYTGQNAALYSSSIEKVYERDNYNLQSCVGNWQAYSFKKDIISVGVAFFGRYFTLKSERTHGLHAPVTGSTNSSHTGFVGYAEICQNYQNWTRVWDDEQKNPYKYYKNKWVGYDDAQSIQLKAAYIAKYNHFGITINSIDKDDVHGKCGPTQNLLKHVHIGLGNDVVISNTEIGNKIS